MGASDSNISNIKQLPAALRDTRCDSAFRSIDNYFDNLRKLRALEFITLDNLVKNCHLLIAVSRFLALEEETVNNASRAEMLEIRKKLIRMKISEKIKEYIDGKF